MYKKAAEIIKASKRVCVFTGAGISVESGIPPFRGPGGLWNKYDPTFIEINYFYQHPNESWRLIKEIFYDFFGKAKPNDAHKGVAKLQKAGFVHTIITQNIDNLHQEAGGQNVLEFHGSASRMRCFNCGKVFASEKIDLNSLPPVCPSCGAKKLKPDFVFFGEAIPEPAASLSYSEANSSDVFIVIGTTGEVMPACMIPAMAHQNGAKVIEININRSNLTSVCTDIFLKGKATENMNRLLSELNL